MAETEQQNKPTKRSSLNGKVLAKSGDKTICVRVETLVKHVRYGKYIKHRSKYIVHDPSNSALVGDMVEIVPCRPISKLKSWRIVRVVRSIAAAGSEA